MSRQSWAIGGLSRDCNKKALPMAKDKQFQIGRELKIMRAKKAIIKSIGKRKGRLDNKEEPEMAIEVLADEIQGHVPIEQALVAEHMFRRTIEESIGVGIAGFDLAWNQIYVNRVFCEMVGWAEAELLEKPYPQLYLSHEGNRQATVALRETLQQLAYLEGVEFQFRHKKGYLFWVLILSNALCDANGDKIGWLISVANIDAQKRAETTLRQLTSRLIDARERERKHIAQDLHDSIGGRLSGIKYSLEKVLSDIDVKPADTGRALKDIIAIVRSTLEEAQRITKNLHPSTLDDLGLLSALRDYCLEFQRMYPKIQLSAVFDLDEHVVSEASKILVYRVLQEALNNVAKHSQAQNVNVSLCKSSNLIELTVEDDGRGFDATQARVAQRTSAGLGLEGMRERAELFGGKFSLDSRMGRGTTIRALWPIG